MAKAFFVTGNKADNRGWAVPEKRLMKSTNEF
jgi:hypothetical protein